MAKIKGSALSADIKHVTPQVARNMLSHNRVNRNVSQSRVERFAQAMEQHEWRIAQPLMFNCDGTLIDGQHRLRAVIECGRPVDFLVIRGYDPDDTFSRIDDTQPRRLHHWFQVRNEPHPDVLATVVTMAARDQAGLIPASGTGGKRGFHLTGPEGCDFLDAHPGLRTSVVSGPGCVNTLIPRSMCCFSHWKFKQIDPALADTFFVDLSLGDYAGPGDPIHALRRRMQDYKRAKFKRMNRTEMLALIYKAWNFTREDKRIDNLRWRTDGPTPEAFPTPR